MPLSRQTSPTSPFRFGEQAGARLRGLAVALVPAMAVLAIAVTGGAAMAAALAAAAVALALGGLLAARLAPTTQPSIPAAETVPGLDGLSSAVEALEALPDPLMLVEGGEPDDFAARRLVFANAAARELLRIPREGGLLVSAIRRPEVLEAVDESLFGRVDAATAFETGGAQDRFWKVLARSLPEKFPNRPRALLLMRDETDARRNERMRADFLANASHELRTPLASLAGFVETLRGHARDDEVARDRFLRIMAVQADRMGRLIEDLLSLSRVELNEHIPPSAECDLALAVADVADAVALLVGDRGVQLDLVLPPPGEAMVVGDRDQILQVIQNLLDNAVKYSSPGSRVRVEVAAGLDAARAQTGDVPGLRAATAGWGGLPLLTPDRTEGERYAVFKVIDAGPGIGREHLPRLAERFYRVEGQKSGDRSGTGLGLAIVKHIVNRHRGGVTVESAPGHGAAFTTYFPMISVRAEELGSIPPPASDPPAVSAPALRP
ncbi:MAG TPA: ATP-binding protein [Caulobacteraceae bacterium]|jgi:two-component system phosphate regulon sensor histidine kinase PhoR|nr:ATP-binding protein [Caulobacteraceae bacterium]